MPGGLNTKNKISSIGSKELSSNLKTLLTHPMLQAGKSRWFYRTYSESGHYLPHSPRSKPLSFIAWICNLITYSIISTQKLECNSAQVTPLLKTLHWYPISLRIKSKVVVVAGKTLCDLFPFSIGSLNYLLLHCSLITSLQAVSNMLPQQASLQLFLLLTIFLTQITLTNSPLESLLKTYLLNKAYLILKMSPLPPHRLRILSSFSNFNSVHSIYFLICITTDLLIMFIVHVLSSPECKYNNGRNLSYYLGQCPTQKGSIIICLIKEHTSVK